MPNWIKGTLKVRGEKSNLIRFMTEGLEPIIKYYPTYETKPLSLNEDGDIVSRCSDIWIKETHRGFIEKPEVYFSDIEYGGIIFLDCRFAWDIDVDGLCEISKMYEVDFRMCGFEKGVEFTHEVEIIRGDVTLDLSYGYDDYQWECPCPQLGG